MAKEAEWTNPLETNENSEVEVEQEQKPKTLKLADEVEGDESDDFDKLSKRTQKRIKTLDRQRKEAQEALTSREAAWQTREAELLTNLQNATKDTKTAVKTGAENYEKQLKDKLTLAKQAYEDAYDSGDKKKLVAAQEAMNDAQIELSSLRTTKIKLEADDSDEAEKAKVRQPQPQRPQTFAKEAINWAKEKKEWFGQEDFEAETAAALAIDQRLQRDGWDPNDPERYEELDKLMKKKFPTLYAEGDEQEEEETPRPVVKRKAGQIVTGGSRSPGKQKVRLSEGELRMARVMGISAEAYAAQKLKVENAGDSYTDI